MRVSHKNKVAVLIVTMVLVVCAGGAALAYWTLSGSGTGTAATGTTTGTLTATQTSSIANLRPGGTPQTLSGTFTNTDASPAYVASITVSIDSVTPAVGAAPGTCDGSDYVLAGAVMPIGTEVVTGATWAGATLAFVNKASNQDACKGATVNLLYTIQ